VSKLSKCLWGFRKYLTRRREKKKKRRRGPPKRFWNGVDKYSIYSFTHPTSRGLLRLLRLLIADYSLYSFYSCPYNSLQNLSTHLDSVIHVRRLATAAAAAAAACATDHNWSRDPWRRRVSAGTWISRAARFHKGKPTWNSQLFMRSVTPAPLCPYTKSHGF